MKLICVEEHAVDQAITRAARPALDEEAPYSYLTLNGTRQFLDELPVIPGDKDKITHRNAERLLRL